MQTTTIVAPKVSRAIGTGATAIGGYTPAGAIGAIIAGLSLCNITGSTIKATLDVFDGANATRLALATPIGVGDSLVFGGESFKFTLVNGWNIRATSDTAASIDAVMNVVEFT